ncbi:hypothetical protein ACVWWG_000810 [Bradyrhizobium sp. LB7.2]
MEFCGSWRIAPGRSAFWTSIRPKRPRCRPRGLNRGIERGLGLDGRSRSGVSSKARLSACHHLAARCPDGAWNSADHADNVDGSPHVVSRWSVFFVGSCFGRSGMAKRDLETSFGCGCARRLSNPRRIATPRGASSRRGRAKDRTSGSVEFFGPVIALFAASRRHLAHARGVEAEFVPVEHGSHAQDVVLYCAERFGSASVKAIGRARYRCCGTGA